MTTRYFYSRDTLFKTKSLNFFDTFKLIQCYNLLWEGLTENKIKLFDVAT